jgi:hypothetical protein
VIPRALLREFFKQNFKVKCECMAIFVCKLIIYESMLFC